jgi:two-component system, chemotaxis family, sensor kinase CheA
MEPINEAGNGASGESFSALTDVSNDNVLNDIDTEDLKLFLAESYENLNQFEQDILSLENSALDTDRLNRLYRALHTIKGNCGFLPLPKLESIAHAGETLLGEIRIAKEAINPQVADILLQLTDTIRQLLGTIETTGTEGDLDYSQMIAGLTALCSEENFEGNNQPEIEQTIAESFPAAILAEALEEPEAKSATSLLDSASIRVQTDLLDHLMNLVGELVLARNQVLQLISADDSTLNATCQQINLITNELQDSVMRTRMQPISTLWRNLPRLVRDLAIACHKQVSLTLEGSETELDRSIIAALKDPLTHLIRNCIDHGIEPAATRTALGKPSQGSLSLRALQENGKVILEIRDDGAGIDPVKVKARSQQLGFISAAQAESMSDQDALNLIFTPGFSTTTAVTHVSGRGVGMDVVQRNLESVNGSVEVESQLGQGTTFRLRIPLTLAILPTLLILSGGERFAIPQGSIQELIRIEGKDQISRSIETLLDIPVYRLRGQILPLVNLADVLELVTVPSDVLYMVVIATDGYRFGLIVDQVEDTQDIVVKPLSKQLKSLKIFTGATVLGNGDAALILDVAGLARYANVQQQMQSVISQGAVQGAETLTDRQLILLVLGSENMRMGIILNQDTRLETIPRSQIEKVGQQYLMQYRDRIVSLINLETVFAGANQDLDQLEDMVSVVVLTLADDRTVGLIVHQILDIVEESLTVTGAASQVGIECYATVQGQITQILDLTEIVALDRSPELALSARR